jgi:hypothetical protein
MLEYIFKTIGGKFFTIEFVKANGHVRVLNGRLGVTKHLKGGFAKGKENYIIVYDVKAKGYRSVNKNTILRVSCGGVLVYNVAGRPLEISVQRS